MNYASSLPFVEHNALKNLLTMHVPYQNSSYLLRGILLEFGEEEGNKMNSQHSDAQNRPTKTAGL